jgi:SAM-dependent methyltransferase
MRRVDSLHFDPATEEAELRSYLGSRYDHRRLQLYERQLEAEFASCGDEQRFYRTSSAYLYNLAAFAMTGTKMPYLRELVRHLQPGSRVLDYGCGIGSDGLVLLAAGYRVEFADFDNPSTAYLRWRLKRRGIEAPVHDLDREVPAGFDAAYAFDVIEHVVDPFAFLSELESRAEIVAVNLLEPTPDESVLHHELPVRALLRHTARRQVISYGILHGRSHLVLYRAAHADRVGETSALARMALARGRRAVRVLVQRLSGVAARAKRSAITKRRSHGTRASLW